MRDDLTPSTPILGEFDAKKILTSVSEQTRLNLSSKANIAVPYKIERLQYEGSIFEDQARDISEKVTQKMQIQIDELQKNVENTKEIANSAKKISAITETQLNEYLKELEEAKLESAEAKKQALSSNRIAVISLIVAILTLIATVVTIIY